MIKFANKNTNPALSKQLKRDLRHVQNCLNKLKNLNKKVLKCVNNITNIEDDEEFDNNQKNLYENFFTSNDLIKESFKIEKSFNDLKKRLDSILKIEDLTTASSIEKIKLYNSKSEKPSKDLLEFEKKVNKFIKEFKDKEDNTYKNFKENTLIISETEKKVILPYSINEIKRILKEDTNEFSLPEEVIEELYTIPIKKYKNSALSRFKEAYKIVRERSNGTIKEALDLAFELLTNYKLHPAIITACKNVYELDIYLSCLEYDELEDFRFFNIIYEIPPAIS